ncbi:MAG TPA: choice-of-anchor D domain-containing protein [Conexibacter sp.]|nr:choice-of-anchor D domain-containing protein [Conexibacter sp.]
MSHTLRHTLVPAFVQAFLLLALAAGLATAAPPLPPGPSPLTAQPSSQDFGLVHVDQGEQNASVWIQNNGMDTVQVDAASVGGDAALRISSDGCNGQMLSTGMGCNVGIGFDPDGAVHYAATLHVPVAGFADLDVALAGTGAAQGVTVAPASLDFGSIPVGESAVRSFTITSTGNLSFQSLVAIPSGGDVGAFRVEHDGCSLQQMITGAACDVSVRFTPPAAGAYAATLLLIGGDSQPGIVPLKGAGAPVAAAPMVATPPAALAVPATLADVAFDTAFASPVPFARGRIDLGAAHCVAAARCTVVVRARVYALASRGARVASHRGISSARTDVVLWHLRASGGHAALGLPAGLRGRPALLVARLRTFAAGRRGVTRTLVVPLAARR